MPIHVWLAWIGAGVAFAALALSLHSNYRQGNRDQADAKRACFELYREIYDGLSCVSTATRDGSVIQTGVKLVSGIGTLFASKHPQVFLNASADSPEHAHKLELVTREFANNYLARPENSRIKVRAVFSAREAEEGRRDELRCR